MLSNNKQLLKTSSYGMLNQTYTEAHFKPKSYTKQASAKFGIQSLGAMANVSTDRKWR